MAKRTIYFEIIRSKYSKELFSNNLEINNFIGSVTFVFNGKNCNQYSYYNEGIIHTSVPGALHYYNEHGFVTYKTEFFTTYQRDGKLTIHNCSFTIDDNKWTFALKYSPLFSSKTTSTITIPKGRDVYKIRCAYENNFEPELILVESFASQEQKRLLQLKIEQDKKDQAESQKLMNDALLNMDSFSKLLNSSLEHSKLDQDYNKIVDQLLNHLSKIRICVENMPYKGLWTTNWQQHQALLERQFHQFHHYVITRSDALNSLTILKEEYGTVNQAMLDFASTFNKTEVDKFVDNYTHYLNQKDWINFCTIDNEKLIYILWFYALYKPFDLQHFNNAEYLFHKVFHNLSSEPNLARWYAILQVSSEDVLTEKIYAITSSIEKEENNDIRSILYENLHRYASGLMWMKAYKEEEQILKYLLKSSLPMSAKEQERLKLLSTSNGMMVTDIPVTHSNHLFTVRMDSLDWKAEEFHSFFDNLAFQNKQLSNALAIRDENQDLVLPANIKLSKLADICNYMKPIFEDEYGDIVNLTHVNSCHASLDQTEEMEGLLVTTEEVSHLGIYALLIRIGKKLNIKFYTLYLPENTSADQQAKKVISMHKKLSPTITMWENSLKETFLTALQQLLNSSTKTQKDTFDNIEQF